ncbi:MAG: hypothetical protein A2654_01470 [Candidatus Nealsonbacteria bacterium RIFCSPHIGHO2_01_FULL_43_31]|uniref:Cupin type-2 domain-containing protein n=2 Tax=Candidatus Nealsoniibacteriota TaxID=1817911 RepID=A0A1G2E8C9_9BACT|nr:MAG: Carbohydrate-binding protein [Parcubacteria group bacterium GW2011_GWB1_43_6]OGZ20480.1 MAG: hypothetical protein A2654_01470 [Candidatus Nealsonbacteria bacterium RIFCSPHIGHO2_01_FULL_43_31]OGZ22097.1 MAG: hypothetical protein A3D46_01985 [Candidatus Nealsonbacteria bacterium RIFCSPHIGHO2_02_FULL_43_13]OGZ25144.1 MAG: hypothetical protein A2922_01460 [Candidatus Nealsonbacteria bacterium RIFCSPLOWO2_01_FULL_43_36]
MYSRGRVDKPIGKRGFLCGAFLPENNPLYTKKVEVVWIKLDSKMSWERHFHKEVDEITIVIKGSLEEEIEGDVLKLKPGDFVLVKSGSVTHTKKAKDGTVLIVIKAPSIPTDKYLC